MKGLKQLLAYAAIYKGVIAACVIGMIIGAFLGMEAFYNGWLG